MKLVWQSLTLALAFLGVWAWQNSPFSAYTIQVLGFLIFLSLLIAARRKRFGLSDLIGANLLGIFSLTSVILLFIFSTGGLSSPLFFLLYFLAFGIAFVFEPATVFVLVVGALFLFLDQALAEDVMNNLIRLGSLALLSPLAFFFGREYRKEEEREEQIDNATHKIQKDVGEILENEKKSLKTEDVEKLDDILEETEKLKEIK